MGQYSGHKFDNCVIEVLTQRHGSNTINFKEPIKEIKNEEEMEKEFNDMTEMSEGIMDSPIEKPKEHPLNNMDIEDVDKIIINPEQAKQMIEEFYAPELKAEVKVDKPTYPYLAKVWDDDYDDVNIAIVVAKIEVGKPKYPILSVCDTDINLFINGEKYDHTWRKNAEPIGYDLESIRTRLDSIESEYKEIEESIQKMNEKRKSLKSEHSNLIEAKELLELMNKAK